jgi:hypothetical protein
MQSVGYCRLFDLTLTVPYGYLSQVKYNCIAHYETFNLRIYNAAQSVQ